MKIIKLPSLNMSTFIVILTVFVVTLSAHATDIISIEQDINRGRSLLHTKKHQEGIVILQKTITELKELHVEQPQNIQVIFKLGIVLFYLEQDTEAIVAFNRVIDLDKRDSRPHFYKALIARYGGKLEEAEEEFRIACKLSPNDDRGWYELGTLLSQKGQEQEAIKAFQKAISLNPKNLQASYDLALSYMNIGQWDAAYPLLKTTIKEQPFKISVVYNMGQLCQNLEKYEEAIDSFLQVIDKDPSDWRARTKLIQLYQATNQQMKRDEQREKLFKMRSTGNVKTLLEEPTYCREQFSVAGENLMVMEYFELKGEQAVRYSFLILDETKEKSKYEISLGSYDTTNAISHELGEIEDGQRLFHLDGYYPNGVHKTFGFFKNEPMYDDVRAIVIKIINGKQQEISSITPDQTGGSKIELKQ